MKFRFLFIFAVSNYKQTNNNKIMNQDTDKKQKKKISLPSSSSIPTLPNGEVIDAKNTLQSYDNDEIGIQTTTNQSNENTNSIRTSYNHRIIKISPPTLPNGNVIDAKNTLQSFDDTPSIIIQTTNLGSNGRISQCHTSHHHVPTLPSGEIINAKNTLQSYDHNDDHTSSFVVQTRNYNTHQLHMTHNIPPTLPSGEVIDAKNTLQSFIEATSSSNNNIVDTTDATDPMRNHHNNSIHDLINQKQSNNQFVLPTGDIMNAKNTLQSFDINPEIPNTRNNDRNRTNYNEWHQPILPNGQIITAKNTLQSFDGDIGVVNII